MCAGGLESTILFKVQKHVLTGGLVPLQFAAGRTVFIPNSIVVDDNGFIVRSPDALRPLTLCQDCHFGDLSRPPLVHHEMYTFISEMHLVQANDG